MSAVTMPVMASRPSVQLPARSARCAARVALRGNAVALRLAAPRGASPPQHRHRCAAETAAAAL